MAKQPRMTLQTLRVLQLMLDSREGLAGSDIHNATKIFSGTLYPILYRFEDAGWLKGKWEKIDPAKEGRPPRKFYELTNVGRAQAKAALVRYHAQTDGATAPAWTPPGAKPI